MPLLVDEVSLAEDLGATVVDGVVGAVSLL